MTTQPVRPGGIWTSVYDFEVQVKSSDHLLTTFVHLTGLLAGREGSMQTSSFLRLYTERDLIAEQTPVVVPGQTWWHDRTKNVVVLSVLSGIVTFEYSLHESVHKAYGATSVEVFLEDFTLDAPRTPAKGEFWNHNSGKAVSEVMEIIQLDNGDTIVIHQQNPGHYAASSVKEFIRWFTPAPTKGEPS